MSHSVRKESIVVYYIYYRLFRSKEVITKLK